MRRSFFRLFRPREDDNLVTEAAHENRAFFLCDNCEQNRSEALTFGLVVGAFWAIFTWRILGGGILAWVFALPVGFALLQLVTAASAVALDQFLSRVFELKAEEIRHVHTWFHLAVVVVIVVAANLMIPMAIVCALIAIGWAVENGSHRPRWTSILLTLLLIGHITCAVGLLFLAFTNGPGWAIAVLVGLLFGMHAVFLSGTLVPNSRLFGKVVRRFWANERSVWLTIDDGVDPETTPQLLDLLRERGVKATFFVIGQKAENHPRLFERITAEGHQIGNHTRTHPQSSWWIGFPWRVKREIGESTALFRSPVGMSNLFVHSFLQKRGIPLIGWSARGLDGAKTPRQEVVQKISRGISPGAILLMHEGYDSTARGYAPVEVLGDVLDLLEAKGYTCVIPKREQLLS